MVEPLERGRMQQGARAAEAVPGGGLRVRGQGQRSVPAARVSAAEAVRFVAAHAAAATSGERCPSSRQDGLRLPVGEVYARVARVARVSRELCTQLVLVRPERSRARAHLVKRVRFRVRVRVRVWVGKPTPTPNPEPSKSDIGGGLTSSTKQCGARLAAALRKQSARFHLAPAYGPAGGPVGSGCSEYQQLLSTHSSPSYKATTVSSSASSVFSGTSCSCTMRAAESSSQARTVANSPVPDGHTVSTTAAGDEAVKRSADCAGDRMRALKACVSTAAEVGLRAPCWRRDEGGGSSGSSGHLLKTSR